MPRASPKGSTSVVCSISNALLDAMYTHTWYVNDAGVLSGVIPGEEGTVTEAYVASSMPETNEDPANIQVWCEIYEQHRLFCHRHPCH